MNTANRIVQALDEINVLCESYLENEGQARYLAGIAVNRSDGLNRLRCTVIAGLPSLKLDRYAEARRARKIV
jgi:hypothetical protein